MKVLILKAHVANPLSVNPTKWSNTQTIRWQQPTNCLSVFDHFAGLARKGLRTLRQINYLIVQWTFLKNASKVVTSIRKTISSLNLSLDKHFVHRF